MRQEIEWIQGFDREQGECCAGVRYMQTGTTTNTALLSLTLLVSDTTSIGPVPF